MTKIYLSGRGRGADRLREILEGEFEVVEFRPREQEPGPGDLLLLDLAEEPENLGSLVSALRKSLPSEAKVMAVLGPGGLKEAGGIAELDDFVLEGSTGEEVLARVRKLMGRKKEAAREEGLVIDEDRYQVRVDGVPVKLTFKEFELLRFLAARPGKVFTREVLLEQVWGYDYFGGTRTVDVHVRRIRAKIEREGKAYIRTVRGVGYIFEPVENP
jgi:DNA-binding response OmpR family regulator